MLFATFATHVASLSDNKTPSCYSVGAVARADGGGIGPLNDAADNNIESKHCI